MKTILQTLFFLAFATCSLLAASPYTLEAPPGQSTNITEAAQARWEKHWDKQLADRIHWEKQFAGLNQQTNYVPTQPAPPVLPTPLPPPVAGKLFVDTFTTISTPDFSHGENWGYGAGVGYVFNPTLSASLRVTHAGLNLENNAVSTVGGRVESRLPWTFLSPYGFLGCSYDLGPDQWRIQSGIGAEIGVTKLMKGLSVYAEGGPDLDLRGHSKWLFAAGLRLGF